MVYGLWFRAYTGFGGLCAEFRMLGVGVGVSAMSLSLPASRNIYDERRARTRYLVNS